MSEDLLPRMDRRQAIKWVMAASAAALLAKVRLPGQSAPSAPTSAPASSYGHDPDLLKNYAPGELWPLTFTPAQRATAAALCDAIIPADATSVGAAAAGVHDFIDEWISAPYSQQQNDRSTVILGLAWLDAEAGRRFGAPFPSLVASQQHAILDDICYEPKATEHFREAAEFFRRFRDLTSGGFYTSEAGMKDLQYVGNVPLAAFEGPSAELIHRLGLDDATSS